MRINGIVKVQWDKHTTHPSEYPNCILDTETGIVTYPQDDTVTMPFEAESGFEWVESLKFVSDKKTYPMCSSCCQGIFIDDECGECGEEKDEDDD